MTKFADAKFTVAAPTTKEYAAGYARTFSDPQADKFCTECFGTAKSAASGHKDECGACAGTGRRAYQAPR